MGISAKVTYPTPTCVACGRAGTETTIHRVVQEGLELEVCRNSADCIAHWPTDDRLALIKAVSKARHPSHNKLTANSLYPRGNGH